MVKIKLINDENVYKIPNVIGEEDKRPIKGADICPELYANIFINSKKKTGKSTIAWHMLKSFATKETTILIFCSTCHKDRGYLNMKKLLKNRGIHTLMYNSVKDDEIDRVETLITELQEQAKEEEENNSDSESESESEGELAIFNNSDSENDSNNNKKKRLPKYRSPKYILVFDDISNELKSNTITRLLKMNRHFFCKVIISSQGALDIPPVSRRQIDLWVILGGLPIDKLQIIHRDCDSSLSFEDFYKLYLLATKKKYNFLYYDTNTDEYRINFNKKIDFEK